MGKEEVQNAAKRQSKGKPINEKDSKRAAELIRALASWNGNVVLT